MNQKQFEEALKRKPTKKEIEDYNSPDLDPDIIYNYLAQGLRTPQNEKEERWQKEGKRILENGGSYEISFN